MNRLTILTAVTAVLATFAATPVLAQDAGVIGPGGAYGLTPDPYAPGYRYGYYGPRDGYYGYRDNDFWPGRVAGDIVGGAIGTAGAIATAPFRAATGADNSYAMSGPGNSYCAQRYRSYDPQSGTFLGYDGRRHPCD